MGVGEGFYVGTANNQRVAQPFIEADAVVEAQKEVIGLEGLHEVAPVDGRGEETAGDASDGCEVEDLVGLVLHLEQPAVVAAFTDQLHAVEEHVGNDFVLVVIIVKTQTVYVYGITFVVAANDEFNRDAAQKVVHDDIVLGIGAFVAEITLEDSAGLEVVLIWFASRLTQVVDNLSGIIERLFSSREEVFVVEIIGSVSDVPFHLLADVFRGVDRAFPKERVNLVENLE